MELQYYTVRQLVWETDAWHVVCTFQILTSYGFPRT
jgi:hypothetical protein